VNTVAVDFAARCVQPAGAAGRFGLTTDCRSWRFRAERLGTPGSSLTTDERFILRSRTSGELVKGRAYRITLDDGQIVEGRTDEDGRTDLPQRDAMRVADIQVMGDAGKGE